MRTVYFILRQSESEEKTSTKKLEELADQLGFSRPDYSFVKPPGFQLYPG
jgi:hypothetical protein